MFIDISLLLFVVDTKKREHNNIIVYISLTHFLLLLTSTLAVVKPCKLNLKNIIYTQPFHIFLLS